MPERIAAGRFFEEIESLPCIVGGVGERSGEAAAALFEVFGAPIVQTTPIQAELAKIWTNILRYTMFALPNRLMMECEQYGANVFEVIDLINRDYPRGGMAPARASPPARACARTSRSARSARPRRGCCWPSRACTSRVPLFLVEGLKRRLGLAARPQGRGPRAWPSRPTPTTSATRWPTSSSGCSSASWPTSRCTTRTSQTPTQSFDEAVLDADAVVIATNHSEFRGPGVLRAIADSAPLATRSSRPVGHASAPAQVFGYAAEVAALAGRATR